MNDAVLMLIVGFAAGGAVASIVWAVVGSGRRKKAEAEAAARGDVADTVIALLADADVIASKYRNGEIPAENYRRSMGDKCGAARKVLRENMAGLDGFFVKYADQEIRDYLRAADSPGRRGPDTGPAADVILEPVIEPALPAPAVEVAPRPAVEPELAVDIIPEPVIEPVPEPVAAIAPEPVAEPEFVIEPTLPAPVVEVAPQPVVAPEPVVVEPEPVIEPVPEPVEESVFDLPVSAPATETDAWSERSIEEFEAAFAKFEDDAVPPEASAVPEVVPALPPVPAVAEAVPVLPPEAPAPAVAEVVPVLPPVPAVQIDEFETPTMEIPVSVVRSAMPAQPVQTPSVQAPSVQIPSVQPPSVQPPSVQIPPVQTPSIQTPSVQTPSIQTPPVQTPSAPPPAPPPPKPQDNSLGITGDDVLNVLDSMFDFK